MREYRCNCGKFFDNQQCEPWCDRFKRYEPPKEKRVQVWADGDVLIEMPTLERWNYIGPNRFKVHRLYGPIGLVKGVTGVRTVDITKTVFKSIQCVGDYTGGDWLTYDPEDGCMVALGGESFDVADFVDMIQDLLPEETNEESK